MVIHLLQRGVDVLRLIGPTLGHQELRPDEVAQHLFQRLAVLLVDAEEEEGQHQADHQQGRCVVADTASGENVSGYSDQAAHTETNELAGSQVKSDFRSHFGEVFGDRDKGHYLTSRSLDLAAGWSPGTGFAASWALMEGLRLWASI